MARLDEAVTKFFFDRDRVVTAMGNKVHRALSATGAYGMTVMRNGMKAKVGVSEEGGYPNSHQGQLRDLIFFSYNPRLNNLVIGPTLFAGSQDHAQRTKTVPELINEGGVATREITTDESQRTVVQHYGERPFVELTAPKVEKKLEEKMEKLELK